MQRARHRHGVFVQLSTDYRIGVRGAFKITGNEVAIGMTIPRVAIEICRQRLAPAHFVRAVALAEPYANDAAVEAGFLDRVVDAEALDAAAREVAGAFAKLDLQAHAATKQRMRAQTMTAMHAAMEADAAAWRAAL